MDHLWHGSEVGGISKILMNHGTLQKYPSIYITLAVLLLLTARPTTTMLPHRMIDHSIT